MRSVLWLASLALALGCTSVKVVKRDGCWVRRSEGILGRVHEEIGPCVRDSPQWSQDRLTRLVQECVADADWRWHARELEVWSRRLPYATPQPKPEEILGACMDEARNAMAAESDAGSLRSRLSEVSGERDGLRTELAHDRLKLQENAEHLAEWLGKAAIKPPGSATANATSSATSDGKASNQSGATLAAQSGSAPAAATPAAAKTKRPAATPAPGGARASLLKVPAPDGSGPAPTAKAAGCDRCAPAQGN